MRLGISPFASTRDGVIELSALATDGGLDTLWLGDGYIAGEEFPGWAGGMESMTELAWLAGRFPHARVGITAAVLPLRDPRWLAKQANTLDNVTEGGFVLVVAPGFWARDFEHRGLDYATRSAMFDEYLAALRAALAGDGFVGETIRIPSDGRLAPSPASAGVPVWLAGARATMSKAIELGLTYQSSRATPDELAPVAADYFDRGGTSLAHRVRIQATTDHAGHGDLDWHVVAGSASQLVDALGRFRELGVADLSIVPGQDDETSRHTLEVLTADVVPQLGWPRIWPPRAEPGVQDLCERISPGWAFSVTQIAG